MRSAALVARAGLGERFLQAAWADDVSILLAIAEEVEAQRERERDQLAFKIARRVGELLGG